MNEFLDFNARNMIEQVLLVFATLFPIVNPVGRAPVFLAMTVGLGDPSGQRRLRG
jgi:small neutral amino acid transporter SnatA (MarC family)